MATLTPAFHTESQQIHGDHTLLIRELRALDLALDRLENHSEVFGNLATAKEVQFLGKALASELPDHFRREERTILTTVSKVSPQLAEFAREMERQHEGLRARLNTFCVALEELEAANDLDGAIADLKKTGKVLTCELGRHIALEEEELAGFL